MNNNKELLENQYKSFINKNDWYFFEGLGSYVRKILNNKEIKNIVHNIEDDFIKEHWNTLLPIAELVNKNFISNSKNIAKTKPSAKKYSIEFMHINQKYSTKINKRNNNKELIEHIDKYNQSINELHIYIIDKINNKNIKNSIKKHFNEDKLRFYKDDGLIEYKNKIGQTKAGKKDYALLLLLNEGKKTAFNIEDIKKYCNNYINIEKHRFKGERDIDDTIIQIKHKLKVKKGSFFPIQKRGKTGKKQWLWIEN